MDDVGPIEWIAAVADAYVPPNYVRRVRSLVNVEAMPNRDPSVKNGLRSVTEGKVRWGRPRLGGLETIMCVRHGAMLRVGEKLWRCPTCNEGCYTPDGIRHTL